MIAQRYTDWVDAMQSEADAMGHAAVHLKTGVDRPKFIESIHRYIVLSRAFNVIVYPKGRRSVVIETVDHFDTVTLK